MTPYLISHLEQLESESIHILREVVAEFENPGDALFHRKKTPLLWFV